MTYLIYPRHEPHDPGNGWYSTDVAHATEFRVCVLCECDGEDYCSEHDVGSGFVTLESAQLAYPEAILCETQP